MRKIFKVQSVLLPYWGEAKFQKGKGSDTKERSDPAMSTVIFSVVIISSTSEERKANATLQLKSWETFSKVSLIYFLYFDTFFSIKLNQKKKKKKVGHRYFRFYKVCHCILFVKSFEASKQGFSYWGEGMGGAPSILLLFEPPTHPPKPMPPMGRPPLKNEAPYLKNNPFPHSNMKHPSMK